MTPLSMFHNTSVAIVGNAKSLFDNTHGCEIDKHDAVCRIHTGCIIKEPVAQGSRIDVAFFSPLSTWRQTIESLPEKVLIIYCTSRTTKIGVHCVKPREYIEIPDEINSKLKHELGLTGTAVKPSTGLMTINYVRSFKPRNITLYGFDHGVTQTFYTNESSDERGKPRVGRYGATVHGWREEEIYVNNLIKKGRVKRI